MAGWKMPRGDFNRKSLINGQLCIAMFDCQRAHISAEKRFDIILYLNVSLKGIYTLNKRGMTGHEEERARFGTNSSPGILLHWV